MKDDEIQWNDRDRKLKGMTAIVRLESLQIIKVLGYLGESSKMNLRNQFISLYIAMFVGQKASMYQTTVIEIGENEGGKKGLPGLSRKQLSRIIELFENRDGTASNLEDVVFPGYGLIEDYSKSFDDAGLEVNRKII